MKNYIVKSLFLVTLLSLGACKNETPQKLTEGKTKKEISSSDEIAMYPTAAASVAKIAYNTLDGKIKIAAIQIK